MALRFSHNRWLWTVLLVIAGGVLLLWSYQASDDPWVSGVLVNTSTTLILFSPLLLVGRLIERQLGEVRTAQQQIERRQDEAASNFAALANEVSQTQAELRRTREELSEAVTARFAATREKDAAMFQDIEEAPTYDLVFDALLRASELHLITAAGCRVPLRNTNLYIWFETPMSNDRFQDEPNPADGLAIRLERIDGSGATGLWWQYGHKTEDFLVELAEALVRRGEYPGDKLFDPGRIFADLRELLELAHRSATGGSVASLTSVVQFCAPQWVVTDTSLTSVNPPYTIQFSRIGEAWREHLYEKPWLDGDSFDEAFEAGLALFKARKLAVKPPSRYDDEPSF